MELCKSLQCPQKTTDRIWHRLKTVSGAEETLCNKLQLRHIPCYYPRTRIRSKTEFDSSSSMFPGNVFAALTEQDLGDLSNEFFIEGIEENQPKKRADLIDWDIVFMVFAERLNCFYPFRKVDTCPPCPIGINGIDFVEIRGQEFGYILVIPEKKNAIENVFFRFDSISANIGFTLPQSLWGQVLSIK
jgi:hypothetical protein